MISDATVNAECDWCGEVEGDILLTALGRRGEWDERNFAGTLKRLGWIIRGDKHYCGEVCVQKASNEHLESKS